MKTIANILTTLIVISSVIYSSQAQVKFSERAGGNNGEFFMLPSSRQDVSSTKSIKGIAIQHGRRIESILVEYTDGENEIKTESIGNNTGEWSYIDLEEGEFITYITGQAGTLIDQLTFHTSLRRKFGPYGGNGGEYFEITVPPNALIIGFAGKAGPSIKQIGLIYKIFNNGNGEVTKRSERGTRYVGKGISDQVRSSERVVRDHRIKKSKDNQPERNIRDHRTSKGSSTDLGYTEKKNKEEDTPEKRFAKKFLEKLREISKSKDKEIQEESSETPEESPEKKD